MVFLYKNIFCIFRKYFLISIYKPKMDSPSKSIDKQTPSDIHNSSDSDTDKDKREYWKTYHRNYSRTRYNNKADVRIKKKIWYYRTKSTNPDILSIISNDSLNDEEKLFEILKIKTFKHI
jgi:hypothetical protein